MPTYFWRGEGERSNGVGLQFVQERHLVSCSFRKLERVEKGSQSSGRSLVQRGGATFASNVARVLLRKDHHLLAETGSRLLKIEAPFGERIHPVG